MTDPFLEDEEAGKRRELEQRLRAEYLLDLRCLLEQGAGQRVFRALLLRAGWRGQSYTGETASTNFNEGRYSQALALQKDIEEADIEALFQMLRDLTQQEKK